MRAVPAVVAGAAVAPVLCSDKVAIAAARVSEILAPEPNTPYRRWQPLDPANIKGDIPIEAYGSSVMIQYDAGRP